MLNQFSLNHCPVC